MRIIGAADEFWRLRLTRVDASEGLDFEWYDDILYRQPTPDSITEVETWHVEAVRLDDYETIVRVATFRERDVADDYLDRANQDLAEMTKTQFEDAYLKSDPDQPVSTGDAAS